MKKSKNETLNNFFAIYHFLNCLKLETKKKHELKTTSFDHLTLTVIFIWICFLM